jgi:hypothetical protein
MYSAATQSRAFPLVYFKDGIGDISLKWTAELKLLPSTQPLQFELLKADEIDASTIKEGNHN